jgi:ABC-2 type transport system permease protein
LRPVRTALTIAAKDIKRSVRDRSAIALSVVAPLVLAFILSSVLGNADESFTVNYTVVNEDGGVVADRFVERVLAGMEEEGFAEISTSDDVSEARRKVRNSDDVGAAFVIPEGFSDAVQSGEAAQIEVLQNPDTPIGAQIARSVAQGFASELNAVSLSIATSLSTGEGPPDPEDLRRLQQEALQTVSPITITDVSAGSREFDTKTFFAAGMAVFFLFFTAQYGAVSLLTERKEGTLARLLAAPVSKGAIIAAKSIYAFVLGVLSMAILIVASTFLMDADWGNPFGVALLVLAGVFAAMGIQSVVTTLAKTDEQAAGYGSVVGVTLGLLGGTFFPLSQAPTAIQGLSSFTPHAWMMRGFGELSGGAGTVADVLPAIGVLLLMGGVTGAIALVRSRSLVVAR